MGYTCRVWNDEIMRNKDQHLKLKDSIEINYWSNNYRDIKTLEKKGYKMHNALNLWTYYVTGPLNYKNVNPVKIYKNWKPKNFGKPDGKTKVVFSSQYKGAYFCIWCDYASINSTTAVWKETNMLTWASATKMWNTQMPTKKSGNKTAISYKAFSKYVKKIGNFPGYSKKPVKDSKLPKASELSDNKLCFQLKH